MSFDRSTKRLSLSLNSLFFHLKGEIHSAVTQRTRFFTNNIKQHLNSLTPDARKTTADIILKELHGLQSQQMGSLNAAICEAIYRQIKDHASPQIVEKLDSSLDDDIFPENASVLKKICPELFDNGLQTTRVRSYSK